MENNVEEIEIYECPICQGPGILEEENGWCFYVMCLDCGCHTAESAYKNNEERDVAANKAAQLWNRGKVLPSTPGD